METAITLPMDETQFAYYPCDWRTARFDYDRFVFAYVFSGYGSISNCIMVHIFTLHYSVE